MYIDSSIKLGERLKYLRKVKKLYQKDLADIMEISQASYSKIELGETTSFNYYYVEQICKRFNINEDWLLTGSGSMYKDEKYEANINIIENKIRELEAENEVLRREITKLSSKLELSLDLLAGKFGK